MGNVACCKKPNEMIEDKDLFKKTTIKKSNDLQVEEIEPQNPFQKEMSRQPKNNLNSESTNNNLLDLEETKNSNNNVQYIHQVEHQNTNGPSDNLRKRRINKSFNNNIITNNNKNIRNETEHIQLRTNSKIKNIDNNSVEQNNFNSNENTIKEKFPEDKINLKNKIINDLANPDKMPSDSEKIKEKKTGPANTEKINNNIQANIIQQNNINNNIQANIIQQNNINNNIQANIIQQNNINEREIENNNIIDNKNQINEEPNNNISEKEPQDQIINQEQYKQRINNKIENTENINEEPQNSQENQNVNNNNDINNQNYIPQNIIKNHSKIDSQLPDDEDPKDSNEINQTQNKNNNEEDEENQEENQEIKEAYIQDPDGQITPTQQISDSEIAYLYQQCLTKGETEPDDDFSIETYKKFYPEDDPFFIFDKGEVSEGQIISSPDDIENVEIYEGEINEQNKKHGYGILTTPEYVRKGTWRGGEFTGWGRESRRNKEVLEGKFINGALNGKGIYKNSKNNLYTGDFVNSKREGFGELYTNRIQYIGEFKEDKLDGKGIIEFLKEGHKYEGDFKNNEINGRGIFQWKNGDIYEGDMTDGKMNGYGIYKYANGQIYEGEYINGIREGKGRIILNNKIVYEGDFLGGHRVVKGRITSSNRLTNNENLDNNENVANN